MLKSMTGFGRCEIVTDTYKLSVEMKAVNHRYFDLTLKMPKKFNYFEAAIRNTLKQYIQRGKVDVFVTYEDYTENTMVLKYNSSLAAEYIKYCKQMEEQFGIVNDVRVSTLMRCPEVFTMEPAVEDEEEMWKLLEPVLVKAVQSFVEAREREGESLKQDLLAKLHGMEELVEEIEVRFPQVLADYRKKLEDKVRELLAETAIDENRIAAEVTIYADKICVDEETVRLKSHIEATRLALLQDESVGRKLDFIAQEMNREANTILSKSNDQSISDKAIILKTEIEKVREQIQNIE